MAIVSITIDTSGQVGVYPRRVKVLTTDNLVAVTTAGYLNDNVQEGQVGLLRPTDVYDMQYSYDSETDTGTYGEFLPAFDGDGVITLSDNAANIPAGSIVNSDISAVAAIAFSKLAALPSTQILVGSAGNVPTATAVTGDVTISNTGVTAIGAGVIVNADISASAAIALSKLASMTAANIVLGSGAGTPTSTAVTGDVLINQDGLTSIATGVIVNADVSASAAIDYSKLAALTSGNLLVGSAGNVATSVAMSGDATINNAGALTVAGQAITVAKIQDFLANSVLGRATNSAGVSGAIQATVPNTFLYFDGTDLTFNTISTNQIADNSITLGKLSGPMTPASIVKISSKYSNGGGSATVAIPATGTLTSDNAYVSIESSANAVEIQKITPTADTITVLCSADPGVSVLAWSVERAAA